MTGGAMFNLINGNSLDLMPEILRENPHSIIVTDPPFNIGYHYKGYRDRMKESEYFGMLKKVMGGGIMKVVVLYPEALHRLSIELNEAPEKVVSWVYNSNTGKQHRDIAFYGVKPDFTKVKQPYKNPTDKRIAKRIAEGKGARLYDWWNVNQIKNVSREKTAHRCQMPQEVMENVIGILPEGYTIIDPFCGSGTTGAACKKLNRDFIGIELVPEYYEIAKERTADLFY